MTEQPKHCKYIPAIYYTDTRFIRAMWRTGEIMSSAKEFDTEEDAQAWIDAVRKFWATPKMKNDVLFESSAIIKVFK